jgi:hypothetical protein
MIKYALIIVLLFESSISVGQTTKDKPMTKNQQYLEQAKRLIKEFEKELESDYLRESSMALVNVNLANELEDITRNLMRKATLYLWLELLQVIDKYIDPAFNPDEEVPIQTLPPQSDKPLVEGSKEYIEFKKTVAANELKLKNQGLQVLLQRENERISLKAEQFIRNNYSTLQPDELELRAAIDKQITNAKRKAELEKTFGL